MMMIQATALHSCRAHHWAFDSGRFTLTPNYTIVVSPLVQRADSRKFELLSLNQQRMHVPQREVITPHRAAIEWHQGNVFRG
jgi:predicted restriction endonuclease